MLELASLRSRSKRGMMLAILPALRESGLAGVFLICRGSSTYTIASPPSGGLHRPPELRRMCPRRIPPARRPQVPGEYGLGKARSAPGGQGPGVLRPTTTADRAGISTFRLIPVRQPDRMHGKV